MIGAQSQDHVLDEEPVDETGQFGHGRLGCPGGRHLDGTGRECVPSGEALGDRHRSVLYQHRHRRAVSQADRADDLDVGRRIPREVVVERLDAVRPAHHDGAVAAVAAHHQRTLHRPHREPDRPDGAKLGESVEPDGGPQFAGLQPVHHEPEQQGEAAEDHHLDQRRQFVETAPGVALGIEAGEREEQHPGEHKQALSEDPRSQHRGDPVPAGRTPDHRPQHRSGGEGVPEDESQNLNATRQARRAGNA